MPAFQGFGHDGQEGGQGGGWKRGGVQAWGGDSSHPGAMGGSNPLPSTSAAPAGQVYGDSSHGTTQTSGFGGEKPAGGNSSPYASSPYAEPPGGHWNMGQQGAEGAWSNGYNPQWEQDHPEMRWHPQGGGDQQAAPAPAAAPQAASGSVIYGADGTPLGDFTPNPRGLGGFGDARDLGPNAAQMGVFYDPSKAQGDVTGYYSDFVDPALRVNKGGRQVSLEQAGIAPGSAGDPAWPFYRGGA